MGVYGRRVPQRGTKQEENLKQKAAAPHACAREGGAAAAAEPTNPNAEPAGKPIASVVRSLPPVVASDVRQGDVHREIGSPLGDALIARLRAAGVRSADVWAFARRADFDADLVAYVVARLADVKAEAKDGMTESPLRVASRKGGLARKLAAEPREGLDGFDAFNADRHKRRANGIRAVWAWLQANPPAANRAADFEGDVEAVKAWMERRSVAGTDAVAWSKALPAIEDVVLHKAVTNEAARGEAWGAIVRAAKENR